MQNSNSYLDILGRSLQTIPSLLKVTHPLLLSLFSADLNINLYCKDLPSSLISAKLRLRMT